MYDHYQGLIFDLDGTLLATEKAHYYGWQTVLDKYDINFPVSQLAQFNGMPNWMVMKHVLAECHSDLDPYALVKEKQLIAEDRLFSNVTALLPATKVVEQYYGKKPMAVGTGSSHHLAERLLAHFGLRNYFEAIIGADDVEHHKPSPETFLSCAKAIGVNPEYCVVFEDADLGIEAAKKAKMDYVDVRQW